MRLLIVVDVQNDFVSGVLGFPEAEEVIEPIKKKIEEYSKDSENRILFTRDTHTAESYSSSREGRTIPMHCEFKTPGNEIVPELSSFANDRNTLSKVTFGIGKFNMSLIALLTDDYNIESVELVGLVTNICVISNAVVFSSLFPKAEIIVDASCCRSFNKDLHEKSLDVMEGLGIKVINR